MKLLRPRNWTEEKEKLFHEKAGKVSDHVLAAMLGTDVKWMKRIRRSYNIPKWVNRKYTDEQIAYVQANYKSKSVSEMIRDLSKIYPDMTFTVKGIKDRMRRYGMIRTKEEHVAIVKREATLDRAKERFIRIGQSLRIHNPGDVFWVNCYKEWVIMLDNKKYQFYRTYVWEQHNGPLPKSHYLKLKDPNKPITIDNLEIHKKDAGIGAKELTDNWVIHTMMHNKDASHREYLEANPVLIENQRLKIQAIRVIKAIENENRKLAQASQANENGLL